MIGKQEEYTKWLREYPGADRFSIELSGLHPYHWRVSKWSSVGFRVVKLNGAMIGGTENQIREYLCGQLKSIIAAFENEQSDVG
jgi:hypothetical protein